MWKPEGYNKNSSVQYSAANELLEQVDIQKSKSILDIGCGDGKITVEFAKKAPKAKIFAIDKSEEMIKFCKNNYSSKNNKNISFSVMSAEKIHTSQKFDLIFSSFSLHFILNIEKFLKRSREIVEANGLFIAIIPQGIPLRLSRILNKMMRSSNWATYFKNFKKNWNFHSKQKIKNILESNGLKVITLERKMYKHCFTSKEKFKFYLMFSFPHLSYIPGNLCEKFLEEVAEQYLINQQTTQNGQVKFYFPILNVIAKSS